MLINDATVAQREKGSGQTFSTVRMKAEAPLR
jgi:hypothetical protein